MAEQGSIVSGIAGRYASALFELADENDQIDAIGNELDRFALLMDGSDDLRAMVKNPIFTAGQQLSAVSAVLAAAKITGLGGNFIKLVASKRRLFTVLGRQRLGYSHFR